MRETIPTDNRNCMECPATLRLGPGEIDSIRKHTAAFVPAADTYVFGSRTNPEARGGDIDLILLTLEPLSQSVVRKLRRAILNEIGEQKLDIVNFTRAAKHPFKDIAMASSVKI